MFADILYSHAQNIPREIALRIKRGNAYRQWSYEDVWTSARSAAAYLRSRGVSPDERIALFADNSPEWILAYLGIHLAGAVVVPLDVQYTPRELRTILGFIGCRLMLCCRSTCSTVKTTLGDMSLSELIPIDGDSSLFNSPPLDQPISRRSNDLMTVIFTSGTTGNPKGVCLSIGNISSNVQAILDLGIVNKMDTVLALLPLHHCYALTTSVLTALAVGASITFCASLRGPDILNTMVETGVSIVPGVPKLFEGFDHAILDKLRQAPRWKQPVFRILTRFSHGIRRLTGWNPGRLLFRSIHRIFGPRFRFFVSGGAKLDPKITERLLDLGIKVIEGYGLTETSPVVSFNPIDRICPGTVGLALPGVKVKIAAPNVDGVGEVLVRGPNVMQGYIHRPEETAEVLKDGWFHTGDLGFLDAESYLHLTGRVKEVIVLPSGKNIYPEDVEHCYGESPLVQEICVMPVERPDGCVERLCAVIVPAFDELQRRKATSAHEALHLEITTISQRLPTYMRVTELKLVTNELPRTRLGKLRRKEIHRMAFDELTSSAPTVLSPEDQNLLATPGADRLITRLRTLSRHEGPILPSHHIELDLGLDSLARIELDVVLEQEFGINIPPDAALEMNTVGDLLKRLSGEGSPGSGQAQWSNILRERLSPPLSEVFDLPGRRLERWSVEMIRRCLLRLAQKVLPLDIRGVEHLPRTGPYLLCPSHASRIDAMLVFLSLPSTYADRMCFLGAEEFFTSAIMRWVARVCRVIPTGTADTVLASLRRAAEAVRLGLSVCIFPEGAITRDGYLQRPHPGAGILACELNVPVVPILMRGTYDTYSYTHPGLHFRPMGITFGEPIAPPAKPECGNTDYITVMTAWQKAVSRLRAEDDASGSSTAGRSPRIHKEMLVDKSAFPSNGGPSQ